MTKAEKIFSITSLKTEEIKLLLYNGAKVSLDCGQEWGNGNKPSGMIKIDDFAAILLKMIVK